MDYEQTDLFNGSIAHWFIGLLNDELFIAN